MKFSFLVRKKQPSSSAAPDSKNLPTNSDTYVIESEPLDIQKLLPEGDKIVGYYENGAWKSLAGEPLTVNVPPADAKFDTRELGLVGISPPPFTEAHLRLLTQEYFYENENTDLTSLEWQASKDLPITSEFKGHEIRYLIMPYSSQEQQATALGLHAYLLTNHYKASIKPTREIQKTSLIVDLTASQQQKRSLYPAGEVTFSFSVKPKYLGDTKMEQSCQMVAQGGSLLFEQIATTKIVYTRDSKNQITHFDITWTGVRLMTTPEDMVEKMTKPPFNPIPQAFVRESVNFNTSVKPPEPVQPSQTGLFATRKFSMDTEHKKNQAGINSSTTIKFDSHF